MRYTTLKAAAVRESGEGNRRNRWRTGGVRIDALEPRLLMAAPANDKFANAIAMPGMTGATTGTNIDATQEASEGRASVWWSWTPTASGVEDINTFGSKFDTILTVYTGSSVTALTQVARNDDAPGAGVTSHVRFSMKSGTTYMVCVSGYAAHIGSIHLAWTQRGPTDIALSRTSIAEDLPAGTAVGTLTTTQANVTSGHTYSLVNGTGANDNKSFYIDGQTLRTSEMFDYETRRAYTVMVGVTDAQGMAYQKSFAISVTDVREIPTAWSIVGTTGNDVITLDRDGAQYILMVNGVRTTKVVDLVSSIAIHGLPGRDTIVVGSTVTQACLIAGGLGNDTIVGGSGADTILGESGNDMLSGQQGADVIYGGAGNDTISGGDGTDVIYGMGGNDSLQGGTGATIYGGSGNDTITGAGHDTIYTGNGTEWVYVKNSAPDTVILGTGTNHVAHDAIDTITGSYTDIV